MSVAVVIPARWGSPRFPGKPLELVAGRSLIERMWQIASAVVSADTVVVATDDDRIVEHVVSFGGRAVLTSPDCANGTERVREAVDELGLDSDIVVNLQGDAVLTPPDVVDDLVRVMLADANIEMATPAVRLNREQHEALLAQQAAGQVGGTTVTFDLRGNALYFSKSVIPRCRGQQDPPPVWRHLGIYAYRRAMLNRYLELAPGRFEQAEKLEQLRAIEHGITIRVVEVDCGGRTFWSVDNPSDVAVVERILASE